MFFAMAKNIKFSLVGNSKRRQKFAGGFFVVIW